MPNAVASDEIRGAEPAVIGSLLAEELHDERWIDSSVALISGGKSNLTYIVGSAAGEVVLRRPPLGHVLPTAHDMAREYRVLTALADTAVPVPRPLFFVEDTEVLGAPFYVMERVVGHVCRNALPPGYADLPDDRWRVGTALIETLAELHTTNWDAVGLQNFGRPNGFLERQLHRWSEQWEGSRTRDLPALDRLRDELAARLPETGRSAIVHGDYRLDNTMLHPTRPGEIVAILDWELSTLGDPLADLGALLMYWAEVGDDNVLVAARMIPPIMAEGGFPSRKQVIDIYIENTGFDETPLDWYVAFAYFKFAVVCQGIAARAAAGAMLGAGFEGADGYVEPCVKAGRHVLSVGVAS